MKKKLLFSISFLVLLLLLFYFYIPTLLYKNRIEAKLSSLTSTICNIESIRINPIYGKIIIYGLILEHTHPFSSYPFLKTNKLEIDLDILSYLKNRTVLVEKILLFNPELTLTRNTDGKYDFSVFPSDVKDTKHPISKKKEKAKIGFFPTKLLVLKNGTLIYIDHLISSPPFKIKICDIAFTACGILPPTSGKERQVLLDFSGKLVAKKTGHINIKGEIYPFKTPKKILSQIDINSVFLPSFTPFLKGETPFEVKNGSMDISTQIKIANNHLTTSNHLIFENLNLKIKNKYKQKNKQEGFLLDFSINLLLPFLEEDERKIILDFPVNGNLNDKNFKINLAFKKAFAQALKEKIMSKLINKEGIDLILKNLNKI